MYSEFINNSFLLKEYILSVLLLQLFKVKIILKNCFKEKKLTAFYRVDHIHFKVDRNAVTNKVEHWTSESESITDLYSSDSCDFFAQNALFLQIKIISIWTTFWKIFTRIDCRRPFFNSSSEKFVPRFKQLFHY